VRIATLHVRNVPEPLYEALRARAQARGRTIGNEAIAILAENVARGVVAPGRPDPRRALERSRSPRERLSEPSSRVLATASYEAHALGHGLIETEHILLALLSEPSVVTALDTVSVSPEQVREAVERHVEAGTSVEPGPRPFGPEVKRVLELALRDSLSGGEGVIGPKHILLALAADEEGTAGRVLRELGVDLDNLRGASILTGVRVQAGVAEEYCAVALTGSVDEWTDQLNARAREGWQLVEIVSEAGEQRGLFRRPRQ
jgi:ATP-dependent Clp protease ATP-binding subunit ClpC